METWERQLELVGELDSSLHHSAASIKGYMDGFNAALTFMESKKMMVNDLDQYRKRKLKLVTVQIDGINQSITDGRTEAAEMVKKIEAAIKAGIIIDQ